MLRYDNTVFESAVATTDVDGGGEAQNGGLQGFLSSLFSTLGGVFGSSFQEPTLNDVMASRVVAPHEQPPINGLFVFFFLDAGVDESFIYFFLFFGLKF